MKKIIIISLAFVLSLSACSSLNNKVKKNDIKESNAASPEFSSEDATSTSDSATISVTESPDILATIDQNSDGTSSFEDSENDKTMDNASSSSSGSVTDKSETIPIINNFICEYYQKLSGFDLSAFYKENVILDGKNVDFNAVVVPYHLDKNYDTLSNQSKYNAFISDYKNNGKLWDMYCAADCYIATAYDGEKQYGITLYTKGDNYRVGQVGGTPPYRVPSDTKLLNKILETYHDVIPKGRCINLTRYLNGILLTDGVNENILILDSTWDFANELKVNHIYSVDEVMTIIEKMESIIVDNI